MQWWSEWVGDKEERSRTRIIDAGSPRGRGCVEEGSKLVSRGVVVRQWSQRSETYFWVTDTAESDFTRCYTSPLTHHPCFLIKYDTASKNLFCSIRNLICSSRRVWVNKKSRSKLFIFWMMVQLNHTEQIKAKTYQFVRLILFWIKPK